jgi:UDP-N-acetylglucosamine:LPS N-acetylglucosamine transferase
MTSGQLEQTFNESELVLCRSGYTTVMDLAKLGKKCFFIPTPGQFEQEYLAKKYKKTG